MSVMLSAYSIYPDESPLLSLVSVALCLSHFFAISSLRYDVVASPSMFGLVAMMSSRLVSDASILSNKLPKLRSQTNTQLIGDIAPHRMW